MVLGTAAYMAPEQARGRAVDRRADIWAFGVVLFEMLTGTQVFAGETISDTIAAVLTREPDWRTLPASTPEAVRRLVRRCLERDVRRRLQAIGEARLVLESPDAVHDKPIPIVAARRPRGLRIAAAIAAGLVLFTAGWLLRPGSGEEPPVRKLDLALEGVDVSQGRIPAIAPDGSAVAFVAGGRLRVRPLDRLDAVDLPDSDGALFHTWSPDSRHIAYLRNGRAWKVAVAGGAPVDLGAVPVDLVGSGGGAWTADGTIIFAGSDTVGLWAMPSGGGAGRDLLPLDPSAESDFHEVATLPDNRGLLFTVHRKGRLPDAIELLADGERRMVLELPGESVRHPVYSKTGHIIYSRETTSPGLWAVPFSLDRLETTGPPMLVVPGALAPTLASDGTICFLRPDDTPIELVRVSRSGDVEPLGALSGTTTTTLAGGPTGTGYQQWGGVSLSPDGGRVAVSIGFSPGQLTVVDLARGSQSIVATGVFPSQALWSRAGDVLLYGSSRDARAWNIWSRRADGAGAEQRITTSDEVQLPGALTPDGATLVYSEGSGPTGSFFRMPFTPGAGGEPLFPRRIWGLSASFSPDGRYIAYESPESGRSEVYVRPFPDGDQQIQVSTDGGVGPVWSKNGEIFYLSAAGLMAVSTSTAGASATVSKPERVLAVGGDTNLAPMFDVTADGQTFFMLRSRGRARVSLIFNWPRELLAVTGSR